MTGLEKLELVVNLNNSINIFNRFIDSTQKTRFKKDTKKKYQDLCERTVQLQGIIEKIKKFDTKDAIIKDFSLFLQENGLLKDISAEEAIDLFYRNEVEKTVDFVTKDIE